MSEAPLPRITADDGCGGVDEPFDWLEDEGAEAGAWLAAQAHQTTERLASLPGDQRRLAEAIRGALAYETRSVPIGCTGRYLFLNSPADAERPSLWLAGDPAAEGREILHPQRLDGEGGLAATGDLWPSPDGCHAVLAVTHGGRQRTQLVLIAIAAEGPAIVLDSLETPASAWAA